jgi:hypothetical protein
VERLAAEGICTPEDLAAVTDTYILDEDELPARGPSRVRVSGPLIEP